MPVTLVRYWGSHFKSLRHARRVAVYFAECSARGWRCAIVCCRRPADPSWTAPLEELGVEIVYLARATGNFDPRCVARAFNVCRTFEADVFHCDNTHTSPLIGAWLAGVPVRLWSKRSMEPAFEDGREAGLRDRLAISLRLSCRLATRTLPVSERVAEELIGRGIPAARIHVLRSAVESGESVATPREAAREALGYRPGEVVVAAVGRADPVKGWDVLVRAFASARSRVPALRLLLAGSTALPHEQEFKAALDRIIAEHGLGTMVRFTGHLPRIGDVLGAADIFALPSRSEGHALALVEAVRAGLPCVASSVGGAPELIRHGDSGFLFPRGDAAALSGALVTLAADHALRRRFASSARSGLDMPTPEQHSQALYDIYCGLLRTNARNRLAGETRPSAH